MRFGLANVALVAASGAGLFAAAAIATGAVAAPAPQALVRPGEAIGRVALGMDLARVKRALGPPELVNRRVTLGFGRRYVEYSWGNGWWLVGFEQRRGSLRAVRIETLSRAARTATGIRWGSRLREVLRRYPNARCRRHWSAGGNLVGGGVYIRDRAGRFTFFLLGAIEPREGTGFRPPKSGVTGFVVKEPFREVGVARITECEDGWRTLWDDP